MSITRWEYKVVKYNSGDFEGIEPLMNTIGNEGWELIAVGHGPVFYFKRRID